MQQPKAPRSDGKHRDIYIARWPITEFFGKTGYTRAKFAREFDVTSTAVTIWEQTGRTSLEIYKAMLKLAPKHIADSFLPKTVVAKAPRAAAYNQRAKELAHAFEKTYPGYKFAMEGGGWYTIPTRSEPEPVAPPAPEPVDTPAPAAEAPVAETPAGYTTNATEEVLIAVAERIRVDRDRALRDLAIAYTKLADKDAELELVRKQLAQAQEDARVYEALAIARQEGGAGNVVPINQKAAAAMATRLKENPELLGILEKLPKTQALST